MYYIAQIFGALALLLIFISYQKKKKKEFLFIQIFSNIFYALQYLCLNAKSALFMCIVALIRTIVFYRYKKIPIHLLVLFEFTVIIFGYLSYTSPISLIPILIAFMYTYATWQKNLKFTYFIGIVVSILWIFYNYSVNAHIAIISSIIEFIASTMGLYKLSKKR